ncbi:dual specificity protein phosphatase 18 [Alosa alosa]|uniref:dual specificity protein phosphatase 18 n=1 Tax=Alosa alosa TaxID=278164 RepID=UPI0020152E2C|nr:dual specificity protein phosphatase 18 [Alosa alosa]
MAFPTATQKLSGLAQITENLYLGSARAAHDKAVVSSLHVTCIINATENVENDVASTVELVRVSVLDSPSAPIIDHFDVIADKIHLVEEQSGRTLVHCNAGVSRSSTLCLAYLMKYRDMSLVEAHRWVKARRPLIRPNSGFWKQLIEYERRLRGIITVTMIMSSVGEVPDLYEKEVKDMVALRNLLTF